MTRASRRLSVFGAEIGRVSLMRTVLAIFGGVKKLEKLKVALGA